MKSMRLTSLLGITATALMLHLFTASQVFAYAGEGDGGGGSSSGFTSSGSSGGPPPDTSGWEEENIDPEFRTPDFVKNPPEKKRDPWSVKKKPKHWTDTQWKEFLKKKRAEHALQQKEAFDEEKKADLNLKIAQGTGLGATAASAVVGAVAAPAVAPTVVVISIVGDGTAATAGSLAEGKDLGTSLGDGLKKTTSSAILSKVQTGKKLGDALVGFGGSVGYDNANSSGKSMGPQMPPPDFTTPGGHSIYK